MEKLIIEGPSKLKGTVEISGSKNSSLPILAATALFGEEYTIKNVPRISDVHTMLLLLETLGAEFSFYSNDVHIDTRKISKWEAPYDLVKTMRASVVIWGALLGRFGKAKISLPGGCAIGDRPVDQHLKGFRALGHDTEIVSGYLESFTSNNTGGSYRFEIKTVTGTENLILASIFAKSETVLYNCASEPEVLDLINFLSSLGAKITKTGGTIKIVPVSSLSKQNEPYCVIPDRIEAGTFLALASLPGNDIEITKCAPDDLVSAIEAAEGVGSVVKLGDNSISTHPADDLNSISLDTGPYPLFPTDLQAQFMSVLILAGGTSKIVENVFPNRFIHVAELRKLGAKISLDANIASIVGVRGLTRASMQASDLRASASLLIGALSASGRSEIHRVYHLDRGYESIDNKLESLGAKIWRKNE